MLDALVNLGALKNDSQRWLKEMDKPQWEVDPKLDALVVTVTAIGGEF